MNGKGSNRLFLTLRVSALAGFIIVPSAFAQKPALQDAFSPRQGATALVIQTIAEAKKSLHVAAYSFTSRPIAEALAAAHERGVDVEIVLDKRQEKGRGSLLSFFRRRHIPARINRHYAIMHNKFMVIDGKVLELGSFNYTKAAEEKNAENVLIVRRNRKTIHDYETQWQMLWEGADKSSSTD